jgi:hypothetical protein
MVQVNIWKIKRDALRTLRASRDYLKKKMGAKRDRCCNRSLISQQKHLEKDLFMDNGVLTEKNDLARGRDKQIIRHDRDSTNNTHNDSIPKGSELRQRSRQKHKGKYTRLKVGEHCLGAKFKATDRHLCAVQRRTLVRH